MPSILVSGGQLDPNIGALLRRVVARKIDFVDLLVGPGLVPQLKFDLEADSIRLDGREIAPTAVFVRHDVFGLQAPDPVAPASALGWYYSLRGWALSHQEVKCFNRHSVSGDGSKLQNLIIARDAGFAIPTTYVANVWNTAEQQGTPWVSKPVGGGEYTMAVDADSGRRTLGHPFIFQRRMARPELRIYRIGERVFGFSIDSENVDYRNSNDVDISICNVDDLSDKFVAFCNEVNLDFAAADFMRHPTTGELVFLEVNTQPMFVAFDRLVGGRMCDAIIDTLLDQGDQ